MRIKRFEAKDNRTALAMIKEEMGEDAVILATKKISVSGEKSRVEIMAAIDYDIEELTVPPPTNSKSNITANEYGTYNPYGKSRNKKSAAELAEQTPKARPASITTKEKIHSEAQDLRLRFANLLQRPTFPKITAKKNPGSNQSSPKNGSPDPKDVGAWRDQLIDRIQLKQPLSPTGSAKQIIALVGATGVGKTTTAAKLAAWFSLHQGKSVCLLSMDCYRIGATDQLRTYARIMKLPCEVVLRKIDLEKALQKHADKDVIIIDTAGKSPYDDEHVPELINWFSPCDKFSIEPHLVLSATTKKEDIQNVIKAYLPIEISSLVLTKLDETRAYAALCQQVVSSDLPISYLCTGQRVPEDFLVASKQFLDTLFKQGWPAASHLCNGMTAGLQ